MNHIISGRNIEVTPALREDIIRKIKRVERFFDDDTDMHITMNVQKFWHAVTIIATYNGHLIKVEKQTEDMYASIDEAVDTLEESIKKLHAKKSASGKKNSDKFHGVHIHFDVDGEEENDEDNITIRKVTPKVMDIEEAIKQIDVHGYQFYVFLDSDTKQINVAYKKHTGGYCIIDPNV